MASLIVDDSATAIYCVSHSFSLGKEGEDGVTFQNAKPPQSAPLAESGAQKKAKTSLSDEGNIISEGKMHSSWRSKPGAQTVLTSENLRV